MFANLVLLAAASAQLPPEFAPSRDAGEEKKQVAPSSPIRSGSAGPDLDPGIRQMIEAAIACEDDATAQKVLAVARLVAPDARAAIDALDRKRKTRLAVEEASQAAERLAARRSTDLLDNWKGEAELGAYRSTGTASTLGVLGSLDVRREGIDWTHALAARGELQRTNGTTSTERLSARYQPSYRLAGRTYGYGLALYEHDLSAGFDNRFTLGGGLGYRAVAGDGLVLDVEGGPAFRHVDDFDGASRSHLVGRASLDMKWQLTPSLSLKQKAALFLENGNGNAAAQTALDAKLVGPLKVRLSYDLQYEQAPVKGGSLNTQTRASFVYAF